MEEHIDSRNLYVQVVYLDELFLQNIVTSLSEWNQLYLVLCSVPSLIMPNLHNHNSLVINYLDFGWDIYLEKPLLKYLTFSERAPYYQRDILNTVKLNRNKSIEFLDEVLELNTLNLSDRYNRVACNHVNETISSKLSSVTLTVAIGALLPNESLKEFKGLYEGC